MVYLVKDRVELSDSDPKNIYAITEPNSSSHENEKPIFLFKSLG